MSSVGRAFSIQQRSPLTRPGALRERPSPSPRSRRAAAASRERKLIVAVQRLSRDSQIETLTRLALGAEYRDDGAHRHTELVARTSRAIATQMGLPASQQELIYRAAPLHDVGKLAVPGAILLKPGKLTRAEFEQVKRHTTTGGEILAGSTSAVVRLAEQVALTHHEWWDGSGYPAGLAGNEIPVSGRIVGLADVFDALTHERPYKRAWAVDEAVAEIRDLKGRQFDPDVVEAFLKLDLVEFVDLPDGRSTPVDTRPRRKSRPSASARRARTPGRERALATDSATP